MFLLNYPDFGEILGKARLTLANDFKTPNPAPLCTELSTDSVRNPQGDKPVGNRTDHRARPHQPSHPSRPGQPAISPHERNHVVQVAVPVPLRRLFDYRWEGKPPAPGVRVKVPFGGRTAIGVVVSNHPPQGTRRLKSIGEVLDDDNLFGERLLHLLLWASNYYHHPPGEVLQTALPVALRKGKSLADPTHSRFICALDQSDDRQQARDSLHRAPLQERIYRHLAGAGWVEATALGKHFPNSGDALRRLQEKGLIEIALRPAPAPALKPSPGTVELNPQQREAANAIAGAGGRFGSFLLHGITGSGKTEVYLEAAQSCIAGGAQVLILVPEIALTPQLVSRVRERLGDRVCVLHSALSGNERYRAWWRARSGDAVAILGTRSAVFTPLKSPGLIVVDEEHDISYKQQDGFRYHARDLAIKRASMENIPVVLGSATPSMESRHNASHSRHRLLVLESRTGTAGLPRIKLIDLKRHRPCDGFSMPLLRAIKQRLVNGEQSIVFLNRRGFAPIAQCHHCGWQAACYRCDARLTYHRDLEQFRCHHCARVSQAKMQCGECGERLFLAGAGTQRLEHFLAEKFPEACIRRLDRDQITNQHQLEHELEAIRRGTTDIIIGTQLIAKGHDFSKVTLVGVINSDQGLYSIDFRAPEYLFQQLIQVAGRAGRDQSPGEVLIQTAHPHNRILQHLRRHDFDGFANHCLDERRATHYPPFSHIVLWRAESTRNTVALQFLRHTAEVGKQLVKRGDFAQVQIMDAVISPMEKLAGRYRAQLMVRSDHRSQLHRLLREWIESMENDAKSRRVRWSIDIDPMEMF